jgi:glutamine cyclotransferase
MSNGSDKIVFRDPSTFAVTRTITVLAHGKSVNMINELEYVDGEIYANVFQTDWILRIDPSSGAVLGAIDGRGLQSPDPRQDAVLNGIAYDPPTSRLFLTGKLSPNLYEVRLIRR